MREYVKTLPKEALHFLNCYYPYEQGKSTIEPRSVRYCELNEALGARDLERRPYSRLCHSYILNGGSVDDIVDTTEEMNFLNTHTSYASDCDSIVIEGRNRGNLNLSDSDDSFDSEDYDDDYREARRCRDARRYNEERRERKEDIKRRIKEQYLRNSRGLMLPAKWQRECESRAAAHQA
ncbi:hypothetical protein P3T76_011360 [Phytophthora citrophthora]|uniref:Uncharacterized protein n=1 Tax=Phytophthora citrophthora TaxID=4793 RepID=A0AAD9G986_9STRA|nr:hypothetical protein P3T76_011360 [Phytophthora citrophthora]